MAGKKKGGGSSLSHARQALAQAEQQYAEKFQRKEEHAVQEKEVMELRDMMEKTRTYVMDLENDSQANKNLDMMVQQLLANQQQATAAYSDYENRVLVLELQSMVDRYRILDVENLAEQNHELREEIYRLQQENMELSWAVSEGSLRSRKDLAKIELALEITAREKLKEAQEHIRRDVISHMDGKTLRMLEDHDKLKDQMDALSKAASQLEGRLKQISKERIHFRNNAEAGEEMTEVQSKQVLLLRQQLDMAFQMNHNLEARLNEAEARLERACAQSVRDASAAARQAQHQTGTGDGEEDSAFGRTGEEEELAELQRQLRQLRHRCEVTRIQRENWRDRSLIYERACAQLQASLQTLQDQAQLTLPSGVQQSLSSIWSQAKRMSSPEPTSEAASRLAAAQAEGRKITSARAASATARVSSWSPPPGKPVGRIWSANPGMGRTSQRPSTAPSAAAPACLLSAKHQSSAERERAKAKLVVYEEGEEEEEEVVEYVPVEGTGVEEGEDQYGRRDDVRASPSPQRPLWQVASRFDPAEEVPQPQQQQQQQQKQPLWQVAHPAQQPVQQQPWSPPPPPLPQQQQQQQQQTVGPPPHGSQHGQASSSHGRPSLDVSLIAEILGHHGYRPGAAQASSETAASSSATTADRPTPVMGPGWDPAPPSPYAEAKPPRRKEIPLGDCQGPPPPEPMSLTALPMSRLYAHDEAGFRDHMSSSLPARPQSAVLRRQPSAGLRSSLRYSDAAKRKVTATTPAYAATLQEQQEPRRLYSASASLQGSTSRSRSGSQPQNASPTGGSGRASPSYPMESSGSPKPRPTTAHAHVADSRSRGAGQREQPVTASAAMARRQQLLSPQVMFMGGVEGRARDVL